MGAALHDRLHWAAVACVTGIGVWVRLVYLWQPMRQDEARTYLSFVDAPLGEALTDYSIPNNHLFHTLQAKVSLALFGDHLWSLRLPALVAGVLLVPAAYLALRRLYGRDAALLGAAFVSGSSILIEFSSNARGYMLLDVFVLLLVAVGADVLRRPRRWHWPAIVALGALGFYTIPIMLYPFGGVLLWLSAATLWREGRKGVRFVLTRIVPAGLATVVATAALYAPVAVRSGLDPIIHSRATRPLPFEMWLRTDRAFLINMWRGWIRDLPLPLVYALVVAAVIGFVLARVPKEYRVLPAAACAAVALGVPVVQRVAPFSRTWLYLLPLFLGASAAGIVYLLERLRGSWVPLIVPVAAVVVAGALSLGVVRSGAVLRSVSTGSARDAEAIAEYVGGLGLRPRDRIAAIGTYRHPLQYYLRQRGISSDVLVPVCPRRGPCPWPPAGARRLFVVATTRQSPLRVLGEVGMPPGAVDTVSERLRFVRQWPRSNLWRVGFGRPAG